MSQNSQNLDLTNTNTYTYGGIEEANESLPAKSHAHDDGEDMVPRDPTPRGRLSGAASTITLSCINGPTPSSRRL